MPASLCRSRTSIFTASSLLALTALAGCMTSTEDDWDERAAELEAADDEVAGAAPATEEPTTTAAALTTAEPSAEKE